MSIARRGGLASSARRAVRHDTGVGVSGDSRRRQAGLLADLLAQAFGVSGKIVQSERLGDLARALQQAADLGTVGGLRPAVQGAGEEEVGEGEV